MRDAGSQLHLNIIFTYLEGDLDGMKTKLGRLPLLEGLEDERHRAQVRHVQLLEGGHRLRVVLLGKKKSGPAKRVRGSGTGSEGELTTLA